MVENHRRIVSCDNKIADDIKVMLEQTNKTLVNSNKVLEVMSENATNMLKITTEKLEKVRSERVGEGTRKVGNERNGAGTRKVGKKRRNESVGEGIGKVGKKGKK